MSFSGNVETLPLDEVFSFVSMNSLEGMLTVAGGGARLTIYFADGQIFFPFTAKRGTYSLGKILRQTGVLSREALEKHMDNARKNRLQELRALEGQASTEALETARRRQYEEEIHDVFLWRQAYFEFTPGPAPEDIQRERSLGKGAVLDPTGLLMEVARRSDERRRIRRSIPTSRAILIATPGSEEEVERALAARRIDVSSNPFTGDRSLEELLDAWGVPSHEALAAVAPLAEAGKIVPLPLDRARSQLDAAIAAGDGPRAARFAAHLIELGPPPLGLLELGPEKTLLSSGAFSGETEVGLSSRLGGLRAFAVIRELIALGIPFTATAREDGREKRLALSEEQISLAASTDDATPPVARYLRRANTVSETDLKNAQLCAEQEGSTLSHVLQKAGKITDEDWSRAALEKVTDELGALILWREAELEIRNRCRAFSGKGETSGLALALPMSPFLRNKLREGMDRWAIVAQQVPGEDGIFLEGEHTAKTADPAAKFFSRFDGRRTVGELRRIAKADPLEFLRFVQGGLRRGYARAPTRAELEKRLGQAIAAQDDVRAFKLARSGIVLGYGSDVFAEQLETLRSRDAAPSPDARPSIEGDMEGLGLAAVLQGLRGRKRTGTLSLSDGKRETKLYFHRGAVFLLRIEDAAAKEFVDFFLDGESEAMDFVGGQLDQKGQLQESDLDEADLKKVKDEILEVLFWEKARFTFSKNDLPDEFFDPGENVTKVALNTDVFLMEAIARIQEWDGIRQLIPSGKCVLAFASLEAKLEAIQSRGMPEVLTIVDGRHSFDDIVRISAQPRLEVGRLLKDLVEGGSVNVMAPAETAPV